MSLKTSLAVSVGVVLIAGIFSANSANAQVASATSLADQLKAQYKLAKIVPESNSYKVAEPGTMLVIQKDGIFGVPLRNNSVDPVIYAIQKDTDLHRSNSGASTWKFWVGHKVYLSNIDAKHDKVSFTIVECDTSNPAKPLYYKSVVDFEFPNGYLAAAEVGQIEDVISQVLTIDSGINNPQPQSQSEATDPMLLTNETVVKMATFKLGDAVILDKIKSSQCNFDTSPDALIKMKQAGISDAVLQAMIGAGAASASAEAPAPQPDSTPAQATFSVRHRHSLWQTGDSLTHYCSGTLSVFPDGTVAYDCTETDDPSGQCDHVSLQAGSLKQAKIASNGALHLATNGQGNFDFFAGSATIQNALAAVAPLAGKSPMVSAGTMAPPPTPAASNCGDYESCMKKGEVSLEQSEGGAEALGEFEKASQLDPSKGEPLAGKGYAYLQMGQYDNAIYMWDSALKLGATLSSPVCHAGMACGDTGDFLLNTKEVSFLNKKGEKEFAAAPSAVTSDGAVPLRGHAYYLQIHFGKDWRFFYTPKTVRCRMNYACPEPGMTQQKIFADYIHGALVRIAAGDLSSLPSKP